MPRGGKTFISKRTGCRQAARNKERRGGAVERRERERGEKGCRRGEEKCFTCLQSKWRRTFFCLRLAAAGGRRQRGHPSAFFPGLGLTAGPSGS